MFTTATPSGTFDVGGMGGDDMEQSLANITLSMGSPQTSASTQGTLMYCYWVLCEMTPLLAPSVTAYVVSGRCESVPSYALEFCQRAALWYWCASGARAQGLKDVFRCTGGGGESTGTSGAVEFPRIA